MKPGLIYRALLFVLLTLPVIAPDAKAVADGAPQSRGPLLVGSARANGMGEMTTIMGDGAVALWWSPGMLPFDRRVQLNCTRSKLAAGLADDIWFRTYNLSGGFDLGAFGVAAGLGYARLDLSEIDIITESGENIGSFASYDDLVNLTVAVSVADMAGVGLALEHTYSRLSPAIPELGIDDGMTGSARSISLGGAFSPRFTISEGETGTGGDLRPGAFAFMINPIAAASLLHWGEKIAYSDQNPPENLPRRLHIGTGLRLAFDTGSSGSFFDVGRFLSFELLFGYEWDKSLIGSKEMTHRSGFELRLANIFSLRYGKIDDKAGHIVDNTRGWGIGFEELLPFGFRLDYAEVPQADGLPTVDRWELSISLLTDRRMR